MPIPDPAAATGLPMPIPSEYRALDVFDEVPASHRLILVLHVGFEPHLRLGEVAVVDTTDKDPQQGELYMVTIRSSGRDGSHLRIVQASFMPGAPAGCVSFRFGLRRPDRLVSADGPITAKGWQEMCLGRIVGMYDLGVTKADRDEPYLQRLDGSFPPPREIEKGRKQ